MLVPTYSLVCDRCNRILPEPVVHRASYDRVAARTKLRQTGAQQGWITARSEPDPEMVPPQRVLDLCPDCAVERFSDADTLTELLGQLAGAVSMCWKPAPTGEFDSEQASRFLDAALARLAELVGASLSSPERSAQGMR